MTHSIQIAIAQINSTAGYIHENKYKIMDIMRTAHQQGAELLVFPAMALTGQNPLDLLNKSYFLKEAYRGVQEIAKLTTELNGLHVVLNYPSQVSGIIQDKLVLLHDGQINALGGKCHLTSLDYRYFTPSQTLGYVDFKGMSIAVAMTQDVMEAEPVDCLIEVAAEPFHQDIHQQRADRAQQLIAQHKSVVFCNAVGGQEQWVYDGASVVHTQSEHSIVLPHFEECLSIISISSSGCKLQKEIHLSERLLNDEKLIDDTAHSLLYRALVLSLRSYIYKTGFKDVVLGLSGGLDSAIVAAIACDALGPEHVHTIMMPFKYTSQMSVEDAQEMANLLGVKHDLIPIESIYNDFMGHLSPLFEGYSTDTTEENLQSRIRANLLMSISNKTGAMLLNTGNKSELAMGYFTLYGDSCGGFALLRDLYKTQIFELARWRNTKGSCIVERIIERLPSAELRPDQVDQDTLLPYEALDPILDMILSKGMSMYDLMRAGIKKDDALKVINLLRRNEYKRAQGVMGPCLSQSSFGDHWKMPLASRYRM